MGTDRAESALTSARVLTEDSLIYMNRDPTGLRSPDDLATRRGVSVFRRTAVQSLGDYLDANYQPSGTIGFFRETFLDDNYDKRIISPLSPVVAGNPGVAYAGKDGVHIGLRNVLSPNPRGFITFSDKAELDVTARNPSFILRNPIYIDGKVLTTTLGVEYPDWKVDRWSIPDRWRNRRLCSWRTRCLSHGQRRPGQFPITSKWHRKPVWGTNHVIHAVQILKNNFPGVAGKEKRSQ